MCSSNLILKSLQSSSLSNIKHTTPTAWYTVDEVGRVAREVVLDVVIKHIYSNYMPKFM